MSRRQVVMVGMEKWYAQDVPKLEAVLSQAYNLHYHDIVRCQDPTPQVVEQALAGVNQPEQLIFYYTGHGSYTNDEFMLCTKNKFWASSALLVALKKTKAKEVFVIIDACHSGGIDVKDLPRPEGQLVDFAKRIGLGSGTAVLCACDKDDTTPGTSPLTKAVVGVFESLLSQVAHRGVNAIGPVELKKAVQAAHSTAILHTNGEYAGFSINSPGTLIVRCTRTSCSLVQTMKDKGRHAFPLPYGSHDLLNTAADTKCTVCQSPMTGEALLFSKCKWQVKGMYIHREFSGSTLVDEEMKPVDTGMQDANTEPIWEMRRPHTWLNVTIQNER